VSNTRAWSLVQLGGRGQTDHTYLSTPILLSVTVPSWWMLLAGFGGLQHSLVFGFSSIRNTNWVSTHHTPSFHSTMSTFDSGFLSQQGCGMRTTSICQTEAQHKDRHRQRNKISPAYFFLLCPKVFFSFTLIQEGV
jgi:hypothetical protein